jgi:spore maturation protein CgeB
MKKPAKWMAKRAARVRPQAARKRSARSEAPEDLASGHAAGTSHGYRIGALHAISRQIAQLQPQPRSLRILYVKAGLKGPFPDLDAAVLSALRAQAAEVIEAGPGQQLAELAGRHRPDLVLVMHGTMVPEAQVSAVRALGVKTAIWLVDEPYVTDVTLRLAPAYEYIFTHELSAIPLYQSRGCQVFYLPLGVNSAVYMPKYVPPAYQSDICFIGNAFPNRVQLIDRLAPFLAARDTRIVGLLWRRLKRYSRLQRGIRLAWISASEAADYYNGAKIVINIHRAHEDRLHNRNSRNLPGLSINPRTYEIAACGALQLTDVRHDLTDHYTPGVHLETYANPAELMEKAAYYLMNETKRRELAAAGFRHTLEQHTYHNRVEKLLGIVFP